MAALARGLGAACRISVARLRPAESDVRSMSSTRSKTVGAVRQVRGGAEANYSSVRNWHRPVTVHSTGTLKISRTVLLVRAASTAVAECSCTGMTLATGSPQLDNTISKPYCLFRH